MKITIDNKIYEVTPNRVYADFKVILNNFDYKDKWKGADEKRILTSLLNSQIYNLIERNEDNYEYKGFIILMTDFASTVIIQDMYFKEDVPKEVIDFSFKAIINDKNLKTCKYWYHFNALLEEKHFTNLDKEIVMKALIGIEAVNAYENDEIMFKK